MSDLIIPVYLNQRIVFDLIAILYDGIATVTRLTTTEETRENKEKDLEGTFGLGQALSSLLKVNLSAARRSASQDGSTLAREEERVHTPASLFHKLRETLKENKQLVVVDCRYTPKPGDIIEFSSILQRNPLVQLLDSVMGILDIITAFTEQPRNQGKRSAASNRGQVPHGSDLTPTQLNRFILPVGEGG